MYDVIIIGAGPAGISASLYTIRSNLKTLLIYKEKSALEIKNLVRGLNPIMGAFTFINDKKIKLWKVNRIDFDEFSKQYLIDANHVELGQVILANDKQGLFLKAKDAVLEVMEMQVEGSKRMNSKDYLRGNKLI